MGRQPRIDHVRESFLRSIGTAERLFNEAQRVAAIRKKPGMPKLHLEQARRVGELAFMGVTASWEEFLEQTFIRYLCGAKCVRGYSPRLRLGKCSSLEHAYQVLSGDPKYSPSRRYLSWAEPVDVVNLAEVFFSDGRPYADSISRFKDELEWAFVIRNRVVHTSSKAKRQFREIALRILQRKSLSQGYGAGDLLKQSPGQGFGSPSGSGGRKPLVFEAYMNMFRWLAQRIAPAEGH